MGESKKDALRVNFDNKLKLEFHGVKVTSDAGVKIQAMMQMLCTVKNAVSKYSDLNPLYTGFKISQAGDFNRFLRFNALASSYTN